MSMYCSRYPNCGCDHMGIHCHLSDTDFAQRQNIKKDAPVKKLVIDDKLLLQKIIYAKPFKMSADDVKSILNLEVETHIRNNPDVEFAGIGDIKDNADRSKTFNLLFKFKTP